MEKINLAEKLSLFDEHWTPKIIADINDFQVKLSKLKGEFVWHKHDTEDDFFLVLKGTLTMRFRDRDVVLREGESIVVPHGVEHLPAAEEEVHVLFIEKAGTRNTGDAGGARTIAEPERI